MVLQPTNLAVSIVLPNMKGANLIFPTLRGNRFAVHHSGIWLTAQCSAKPDTANSFK